ncbi:MAG: NADPH:quinone reductase-like Zn-dependent oxidoreductase [Cyclobacteriaceae bacterium]|jgi:NADPH:quinone reductase-like Zn-dependent oxidoreductase
MRAYQLVKNGAAKQAFSLIEMPTPVPKAGEVLIASEGFGLNFADVMARLGIYKDCPPLPAVIGYENVGHIKAVGADVTSLKVGDRVLAFTRFGGYADHVISNEMAVVKIPETLTITEATALATQYITAYFAAEETVRLHKGDHVLIHAAAGGVGTALIQLLKRKGCVIFGTAGSVEKMEYLKALGVDFPINYRENDYLQVVDELGFKGKLDATFNPVGGDYVKKDFKLLNAGGRVVLYGASKLTEARGNIYKMIKLLFGFGFWSPIGFVSKSTSLIGINMLRIADNKPLALKRCLDAVIALAAAGEIKPTKGTEFSHTELAQAHDYLGLRKSVGKVAIRW